MTEYTKGSWATRENAGNVEIGTGEWEDWGDGDGVFSDFHVATAWPINGEMEANANLIAAAPDLYEALCYARRFVNSDDVDTKFIDAALAKARGEAAQ